MEKRQAIERLAESDADRILLARIYDRIQGAVRRNIPAATCFLTQREQALARQLLPDVELVFFGGRREAERAVCCSLPDYLEPDVWLFGDDGPICAVRAEFYAADALTHRDFLGALMGCGIKRETVGDLYVQAGRCDFLVTREILPYVLQNLDAAGRTKLRLSPLAPEEISAPPPQVRLIRDTVAALRLDSILAAGFGLSRARAAQYVESGRTAVNALTCLKPDRLLRQGDTVSVRGLGKIELAEAGGTTKKGRTGVQIRRFV